MAKSKKKPKKPIDDEVEPQVKGKKKAKDEDVEVATELDADAEEAAEADADEPATEVDADEEPADADEDEVKSEEAEAEADADAGDDEGDDDEDSEDTTPPPPKPKVTKTATALIVLNWMIAPVFLLFAYLDNMARVEYAHRTLLNYIQIWGLPLDNEGDHGSFHTQTRTRLKLTSEQLSEAVKARTRKTYKELAAYEEPMPLAVLVRKSDMTELVLKDVFGYQGLSNPVATLEDEIKRIKTDVPAKIEAAGTDVLAALKTDAEKRAVVQQQLFDIAWDYKQIHRLADKLANAKGAALDEMVKEAVQRRLYYDILAPLNLFRSDEIADASKYKIEKISNLKDHPLDKVKGFFADLMDAAIAPEFNASLHLGEAWAKEKVSITEGGKQIHSTERTSSEKRQVIGFIMFTLSQVRVAPLEKKVEGKIEPRFLIDKGVERAQVVCGLSEFTNASLRYVVTIRVLNERKIQAVNDLRDGYAHLVKGETDKYARTLGTTEEREREIERLVKIVEHIDAAKKRLADLQGQKNEFDKVYVQRQQQYKDTLDKLLSARAGTEKHVKELRQFQEQLHTALVDLSEAGDRNLRLYQEIFTIEMEMAPKNKGGKK